MLTQAVALLRALRIDEWWSSKLTFVLSAFLVSQIGEHSRNLGALDLLAYLAFAALLLAFGYALNDWCDRSFDAAVGKRGAIGSLARWQASVLLALLTVAPLATLIGQPWICVAIGGVALIAAAAYSAPPLRLKTKGAFGVLVAAFAQRTAPCLVVFAAGAQVLSPTGILFLALTLVVGVRWMLLHQIGDVAGDAHAGVPTFVCSVGVDRARRWPPRLVLCELVLVVAATICLPHRWAVVAALCVFAVATWSLSSAEGSSVRRYLASAGDDYGVLADLYYLYWPLGLIGAFAFMEPMVAGWCLLALIAIAIRPIAQHLREVAHAIS